MKDRELGRNERPFKGGLSSLNPDLRLRALKESIYIFMFIFIFVFILIFKFTFKLNLSL